MSKLFKDDAPGMDDATRALGIVRSVLTSLQAVETSGDETVDRYIMEAEQALRKARQLLGPKNQG